jgi:hypothetical protein
MERLHETEASLAIDQTTTSVADSLSSVTSEIEARIDDDIELLRSNPSLPALHQLDLTWQSFGSELSEWADDLTRAGTSLDEELARLDELNKVWQSTLQSVKQGDSPPEILQRVQFVLDAIERTRQAVNSRQAQVLTFQTRLFEVQDRVRTALSLIEQAERRALARALSKDSPPIWNLQTSFLEAWRQDSGRAF